MRMNDKRIPDIFTHLGLHEVDFLPLPGPRVRRWRLQRRTSQRDWRPSRANLSGAVS